MVMLHLNTKHQNLGNWTLSKYNPVETAAYRYIHYSKWWYSPRLSMFINYSGQTQGAVAEANLLEKA